MRSDSDLCLCSQTTELFSKQRSPYCCHRHTRNIHEKTKQNKSLIELPKNRSERLFDTGEKREKKERGTIIIIKF